MKKKPKAQAKPPTIQVLPPGPERPDLGWTPARGPSYYKTRESHEKVRAAAITELSPGPESDAAMDRRDLSLRLGRAVPEGGVAESGNTSPPVNAPMPKRRTRDFGGDRVFGEPSAIKLEVLGEEEDPAYEAWKWELDDIAKEQIKQLPRASYRAPGPDPRPNGPSFRPPLRKAPNQEE
jgi:hypothetical protein